VCKKGHCKGLYKKRQRESLKETRMWSWTMRRTNLAEDRAVWLSI
jgi:hypothetical protein